MRSSNRWLAIFLPAAFFSFSRCDEHIFSGCPGGSGDLSLCHPRGSHRRNRAGRLRTRARGCSFHRSGLHCYYRGHDSGSLTTPPGMLNGGRPSRFWHPTGAFLFTAHPETTTTVRCLPRIFLASTPGIRLTIVSITGPRISPSSTTVVPRQLSWQGRTLVSRTGPQGPRSIVTGKVHHISAPSVAGSSTQ